jgi:anhydro-N-acetylmuramic acid kinase
MKKSMRILGIMSGSSLDGIDLALCEFSGFDEDFEWKILDTVCYPFSDHWLSTLKKLPEGSALDLAKADFQFSYLLAEKAKAFLGDRPADYVASHGHTVFHFPGEKATCQIGNGGALAAASGIPVVSDFRSLDIGLGGQGAPIVAFFDRYVFKEYPVLINLGGIANLTINLGGQLQAFDLGPCNQLLNYLSLELGQAFDKNGEIARQGVVQDELLKELMDLTYFRKAPPKTLDNTEVATVFFPVFDAHPSLPQDKMRTAVEMISISIRESIEKYAAKDKTTSGSAMLVTGGGAKNSFLLERIKSNIPYYSPEVPEETLIDYKEALMIAFLAYFRVHQQINTLASATGASDDSIGGAIYRV